MQQTRAAAEDSRLDTERRLICKGSALVRFEYLKWNEYIKRNEAKRRPDKEHVERLTRIFRKAGCRPLERTHHIPAIVSQQQLDAALEDARRKKRWKADALPSNYATINTQDGYPELEFPSGIECLHGLHRIQAGKEWLQPSKKWWIVDLYLSGISYELSAILNEEYSNKENPCDGEIYRKIREYQEEPRKADSQISPATCVSFEMLWWARFNKSREKKLRTLFGKCERARRLAASFDALSKIPGLFDAGMMVTTLNKVMATKCYEEICHYNEKYILKVWAGFMKGIGNGFQRIDQTTVKTVELKAPGVSTLDAQSLQGKVLGGRIFSGFSRQEREIIWENIVAFKGIIPSLSKFFQDVHLLQACVNSIRWLVTVPPDQTLFTTLGKAYTQRETQVVQTSATAIRSETGSRSYCMRLAYLGLFAIAMRDYRDLPKAPGEKILKEMPRAKADREVLQRFASFAYLLGFNSPEIKMLRGDSEHPSLTDAPELIPITVTTGPGENIERRCGLPRMNTFGEDKNYLYLDNLFREQDETGEGITSFFVLKSWFMAFFGSWPGRASSTESSNPPPPAHHHYVDEEDVSMGEARPEILNQQEVERGEENFIQEPQPERLDTDEQMQETAMRRIINEPSIEADRTLQDEDTLFVPTEPITRRDAKEAGNIVAIRFVELGSNESDTLNPLQEYAGHVRVQQVERGDPTSRVAQAVQIFLDMGKRTCDRNKKYIPPDECYSVATGAENNNTLFLIPDVGYQTEGQRYEAPESGGQAMEESRDDEIRQEIVWEQEVVQNLEGQRQTAEGLEELDQEGDKPDSALLDNEKDNAANAHILDRNNTTIYLKRRVGDSHDASKPAKDWKWEVVHRMDVPIGDPHDIVGHKIRRVWREMHLKPHDKNLRILENGDCYKVAAEAADHTLYLMVPSPQTEEESAAERTWIPPLPLPAGVFDLQEKLGRRGVHTTPQALEDTGFGSSAFVPPPNIHPLPPKSEAVKPAKEIRWNTPIPPPSQQQAPLVKSSAEDHRDKIGSSRNNKVGMSFQEESRRIRKGQVKMRNMQQHTEDQPKGSSEHRKLIKPRNRKTRPTPDREMAEGDSEDEIL